MMIKIGHGFNTVHMGKVLVDPKFPAAKASVVVSVTLRNLRDPKAGKDMRGHAPQGPKSRDIPFSLGCDAPTRKRIMVSQGTQLCDAMVGGFDIVVSRTGYTGEKMAFELSCTRINLSHSGMHSWKLAPHWE